MAEPGTTDQLDAQACMDSHAFVDDPPFSFSGVLRETCARCGRARLNAGAHWYGSATERLCDDEEGRRC